MEYRKRGKRPGTRGIYKMKMIKKTRKKIK